MMRAGYLKSLEMENHKQRGLPLMFTTLCYATTAYLFYREQVFDELFFFVMAVIAASVALTFFVSFFWKISAHSVGMGGALGLLIMLHRASPDTSIISVIVVGVLLAGAVLSARLALHAHSPAQVYAGFGSGLLLALMASAIAL